MTTKPQIDWTDEQMLMALHLRDHEGVTAEKIGLRFGRTKSAVLGMFYRLRVESADDNGNQNGTMPPLWWRRGSTK